MNKEGWRGQNSVRFIYYTYKDSSYFSLLLVSITLLVVIFLIFQVIIPQFENWFSIRNEAIARQETIAVLNNNISFISNMSKTELEAKRQTVIQALPVEKDFARIINAVNVSAAKSEVSVDDFAFGLGSISSTSATLAKKLNEPDSIELTLSLKGGIDNIKNFLKEINSKLPLSQVVSVDTGESATTLTMLFYSKPFHAPNVRDDQPIAPISSVNTTLLNTLSKWKTDTDSSFENTPERSSSTPLF